MYKTEGMNSFRKRANQIVKTIKSTLYPGFEVPIKIFFRDARMMEKHLPFTNFDMNYIMYLRYRRRDLKLIKKGLFLVKTMKNSGNHIYDYADH